MELNKKEKIGKNIHDVKEKKKKGKIKKGSSDYPRTFKKLFTIHT